MAEASQVIVGGTSAGGLVVLLHLGNILEANDLYNFKIIYGMTVIIALNYFVDYIAEKIKKSATNNPLISGVADAALFMDLPSFKGQYAFTPIFQVRL